MGSAGIPFNGLDDGQPIPMLAPEDEASHRRRQAGDEYQHETQQHEQPENDNPPDSVQLVCFDVSHNSSPEQIPIYDPARNFLHEHTFSHQSGGSTLLAHKQMREPTLQPHHRFPRLIGEYVMGLGKFLPKV